MKGGIDVRRVRYFDLESFAPAFASDDFGSFTFQPTFTGNAFGDFLEGAPTTLAFAVSSPDVGGTATQYSLFGQDEYQVNSRLTLSYGLRWQILPGFQEDGGNLANFDPADELDCGSGCAGGLPGAAEYSGFESGFSAVVQCVQSACDRRCLARTM